ncbi:MAG: hypothetical protein LBN32_00035 [Helicobacteraceae bacterium]|nr:hypothetical protein [Helicobacteraceae bacterium]
MDGKLYTKTFDVKTTSVANSLRDLIAREQVIPASVDFDIMRVQTFIKDAKADEYTPLDKDRMERFNTQEYLLDPLLQISQEYEVRFRPAKPYPFKLNITIAADKFHSMAVAIVKAGSIIQQDCDPRLLLLYFNKLRLKNDMLIYLRDSELRSGISRLQTVADSKPIAADVRIVLSRWAQPIETVNDKLIFHYIEKMKVDKDALRINYADRGFLCGVQTGELLVEHILPQQGKNGRSTNGVFIEMPEATANNAPDFTIDASTVMEQSDAQRRCFFAKTNGYASLTNKILAVLNEIDIESVSLKTTGNIRVGTDQDITINITGNKEASEAIGSNMIVEATTINAAGSVGAGALVVGNKITIKGSTHKDSSLVAKEIDVNVLRGEAKGEIVKVKSLEGGTVHALQTEVEHAIGGEIIANHIIIRNLYGKVKATAAKTITISTVKRGDNKLIIDPSAQDEDTAIIKATHEEIELLKSEIAEKKRAIATDSEYLQKNSSAFKQIQAYLLDAKQRGFAPADNYKRMAIEYLTAQKRLTANNEALKSLQAQSDEKFKSIAGYDESVKTAYITNENGRWKEQNEIVFRLPASKQEIGQVISDEPYVVKISLRPDSDGALTISYTHNA